MEYLAFTGTVINIFLCLFFLFKRNQNRADRSLGWIFALVAITFLFNYLEFSEILIRYPFLIFFDMGIPYLLGPIIYFYTLNITNSSAISFNTKILHFIPAVLVYILLMDLIFADAEVKIRLMQTGAQNAGLRFQITTIIQLIPVPVYLLISFFKITEYRKKLKNNFSNIHQLELTFLKSLLLAFTLLWLIASVAIIGLNFQAYLNFYIVIFQWGFLIFSITIGIYGFQNNRLISKFTITDPTPTKEYESINRLNQDMENVRLFMEEQQPHLITDIKLHDLARSLGMPSYQLSKIINKELNTNFFDFINQHRVESFCKMALNGDIEKYNILAIAYESGFSSKSAFYRAFKKHKGTNPSKWIIDNKDST